MEYRIDLGESPTILLARLSAIGDCMETLPLANELKRCWPKSRILWVVDCGVDALLRGHESVDEVIRVKKGFLFRSQERKGLVKLLRERKVDVAFDPQGLLKSSFLCWLSGAKSRIGFSRKNAREGAHLFYTHRVTSDRQHLVDRQLDLLDPVVDLQKYVRFGLKPTDEACRYIETFLERSELNGRPFCVVNPGASCIQRRWPTERFRVVVRDVYRLTGLPSVVLWGNELEKRLAESIVEEEGARMAPETTLMQMAALLSRSRVVLSGDTGPMHMAVAVETPVVAIFGTTLPWQSGPYGPLHRSIREEPETRVHVLRRAKDNSAIAKIPVESVVQAMLQQIAAAGGGVHTQVA